MNAFLDKPRQMQTGGPVPASANEAMLDVVQSMIQMVYKVALDPDKFDERVATWDAFEAQAHSVGNFPFV